MGSPGAAVYKDFVRYWSTARISHKYIFNLIEVSSYRAESMQITKMKRDREKFTAS